MSQVPVDERNVRVNAIIDGTANAPSPFYVKQYKNYITPPVTPIILLSGQTNSVVSTPTTLASVTIPAQYFPLRFKKILVDVIPPSSATAVGSQTANSVAVQVTLNNQSFIIYQRFTAVNQPFNDSQDLAGEDAIFTVPPNATFTVALLVTAVATYTNFNVEIITESAPLVEESG